MLDTMKDPVEVAAYIKAAMKLDDSAALLVALRQVAKAHSMAEVARRADVGEKVLFKTLSPDSNPTLTTIHKVLHAFGASCNRRATSSMKYREVLARLLITGTD